MGIKARKSWRPKRAIFTKETMLLPGIHQVPEEDGSDPDYYRTCFHDAEQLRRDLVLYGEETEQPEAAEFHRSGAADDRTVRVETIALIASHVENEREAVRRLKQSIAALSKVISDPEWVAMYLRDYADAHEAFGGDAYPPTFAERAFASTEFDVDEHMEGYLSGRGLKKLARGTIRQHRSKAAKRVREWKRALSEQEE